MFDNEYRLKEHKGNRDRLKDKIRLKKFEEIFFFARALNREKADKKMEEITNDPEQLQIYEIYKLLIEHEIGEIFLGLKNELLAPSESKSSKKQENKIFGQKITNKKLVPKNLPLSSYGQVSRKSNSLENSLTENIEKFLFAIENAKQDMKNIQEAEEFKQKALFVLLDLMVSFGKWMKNAEIDNLDSKGKMEIFVDNLIKKTWNDLSIKRQEEKVSLGDDKLNRLFFFSKFLNEEGQETENSEAESSEETSTIDISEEVSQMLADNNIGDNLIDLGRMLVNLHDVEKARIGQILDQESEIKYNILKVLCGFESEISKVNESSIEGRFKKRTRFAELELEETMRKTSNLEKKLEDSIENFHQEVEEKSKKMKNLEDSYSFESGALTGLLGLIHLFENWIKLVEVKDLALKVAMEFFIYILFEKVASKIDLIEQKLLKAKDASESEIIEEKTEFRPAEMQIVEKAKVTEVQTETEIEEVLETEELIEVKEIMEINLLQEKPNEEEILEFDEVQMELTKLQIAENELCEFVDLALTIEGLEDDDFVEVDENQKEISSLQILEGEITGAKKPDLIPNNSKNNSFFRVK